MDKARLVNVTSTTRPIQTNIKISLFFYHYNLTIKHQINLNMSPLGSLIITKITIIKNQEYNLLLFIHKPYCTINKMKTTFDDKYKQKIKEKKKLIQRELKKKNYSKIY